MNPVLLQAQGLGGRLNNFPAERAGFLAGARNDASGLGCGGGGG